MSDSYTEIPCQQVKKACIKAMEYSQKIIDEYTRKEKANDDYRKSLSFWKIFSSNRIYPYPELLSEDMLEIIKIYKEKSQAEQIEQVAYKLKKLAIKGHNTVLISGKDLLWINEFME